MYRQRRVTPARGSARYVNRFGSAYRLTCRRGPSRALDGADRRTACDERGPSRRAVPAGASAPACCWRRGRRRRHGRAGRLRHGDDSDGTPGDDRNNPAPASSAGDRRRGGTGGDAGGSALAAVARHPRGRRQSSTGDVRDHPAQPRARSRRSARSAPTRAAPVSKVDGGMINCPCHGSKFSIEDGSPTERPGHQAAGRDARSRWTATTSSPPEPCLDPCRRRHRDSGRRPDAVAAATGLRSDNHVRGPHYCLTRA